MNENKRQNFNARQLTKVAICIALLCVSSYISIPLPISPVPITTQTIIINVIAIILLPKEAFFAMFAYILLGICGLPVFSGGQGGIGRIFGPTGGYIIGFFVAAVVMSIIFNKCKSKFNNKLWFYCVITVFVGITCIDICGIIGMKFYMGKGISSLFMASVVPFLPGDILKCILGSYIGYELNKRLLQNK